jgi:hypothetical protein
VYEGVVSEHRVGPVAKLKKTPRERGAKERSQDIGGNEWNKIQRAVRLHDILVRYGVEEGAAVAATLEAVYGQDVAKTEQNGALAEAAIPPLPSKGPVLFIGGL